jgi:outer membrane immunogenic protein
MKAWGLRTRGAALTVCCLFAVSGEAWAADLYFKPGLKDGPLPFIPMPTLWEGLYVGGHGGGGWNTATVDDHYDYNGDPQSRNEANGSGLIAGGQIGYNFQWGNIVFGPEADLGYLGLSGSRSVGLPPSSECLANAGSRPCELNANYSVSGGLYGGITGRIGYAMDDVLLYAKGGVAFLDSDIKAKYTGQNCSTVGTCGVNPTPPANASTFNFENSETLTGWTVGGGIEYALSQEWSVKLEYQHFDFGSTSFKHDGEYNIQGTPWHSTLKGNAEISHTVDAIKVGVNFHFDSMSNLE